MALMDFNFVNWKLKVQCFWKEFPIRTTASESELCGSHTSCHEGRILNNISRLFSIDCPGRELQEILFQSEWLGVMWYYKLDLDAYRLCNTSSFFPFISPHHLLTPMGSVYWQPQYGQHTILFIVLISHLLWITCFDSGECHRSYLYKIKLPLNIQTEPVFFFPLCSCCLARRVFCCLWFLCWKAQRHRFL